jgi:hypothetical protein
MWRLRRLYSTARFLAAVDCVKAAEPPKGPARAAFCRRTMQTFWAPPAEPWQVMPWGIWTYICVSCVVEMIADIAYLDGEVHDSSGRETTDTDSGNVLGNLCILEGSGIGSAGSGINGRSQRSSAVLVDLVEGHRDGTVVGSGGKTLGGTLASSSGNTSLGSALRGLGSSSGGSTTGLASATSTAGQGVEKTTLVGSSTFGGSTLGGSTSSGSTSSGSTSSGSTSSGSTSSGSATCTHEGSDSRSSINGTSTLGTAKSGGLAAHLLGADDGGISLRAGERVS